MSAPNTGKNPLVPARIALQATAIVLGLAVLASAVTVKAVGESPLNVAMILVRSAFSGADSLTTTLFYVTPLLLTGAAVLVPYRAGLFNIGAEGQLYMGALAATVWGLFCSSVISPENHSIAVAVVAWVGGLLSAFVAGGLYAVVAGWLKTSRGVHEVMATIMMNFIALSFSNWAILYPLKNPETQGSETRWIAPLLRLPKIYENLPASFPLAVIAATAAILALRYSWWGYRVRVCGENPSAARVAGIRVKFSVLSAFFVGGGLAGLVGFHEVYCASYRLIDGFSPQFGFTGIAIALLCRGNLPAFFASALFFAAIHKGTLDLDMETENITRDMAAVIQAWLLIALAMGPWLEGKLLAMKQRRSRS